MTLTVGSLFAGIGGLDLGFERAGFQIKWQVEIDDYCKQVLAKHWPDVARYEDVREVGAHNLERVDVLMGGFPCQDISSAGNFKTKRKGLAGKRSGLWSEYRRIIGELRPQYAVVENVSDLFFRGIDCVLGELAAIGYDADWATVRASEFGLPHQRERVFIVAYPHSERLQTDACFPKIRPQTFDGRYPRFTQPMGSTSMWTGTVLPEPCLCRVNNGVSSQLDKHRLRGLGNAVVPQVAEYIAHCVRSHAEAMGLW